MGMAASQARFLSLTARKSNVEYEGQQVNQQRTALSNESANLYNKLMALDVPTPPDTSEYYSAVYTFTSTDLDKSSSKGATNYEFSNIYSTPNGNYVDLSYTTYQWQSALTTAYRGDIYTKTGADNETDYYLSLLNGSTVEATKLEYQPTDVSLDLNFGPDNSKLSIGGYDFVLNGAKTHVNLYKENAGTLNDENILASYSVKDLGNGKYQLTLSVSVNEGNVKDDSTENDANSYFFEFVKDDDNTTVYNITKKSDGTYSAEISDPAVAQSEVSGAYFNETGRQTSAASYLTEQNENFFNITSGDNNQTVSLYNQPILAYNIGDTTYYITAEEFQNRYFASSSYVYEKGIPTEATYPCIFTTAPNGRYKSILLTDEYGNEHEYSLAVENRQDEQKYDQAMLDYQYEKSKYDKEVANINAKTEKIQAQDRTLELRLKQLDTEQNAISTEMDAVKKVIEDNVESTFKTFA